MELFNLDSRNVCPIWPGRWEQPPGPVPCGDESQDTSREFPKESHKNSPFQRHFYGPATTSWRSERQLGLDPWMDIPGKAQVPFLCRVSQKNLIWEQGALKPGIKRKIPVWSRE